MKFKIGDILDSISEKSHFKDLVIELPKDSDDYYITMDLMYYSGKTNKFPKDWYEKCYKVVGHSKLGKILYAKI